MKILLVDDETLDLFLVQKQLSLEYTVVGFTTPDAALTWAKENDFDVVLIDYYLGALTGDELLQKLATLKTTPFKAFLLTNFVNDKQVEVLKSHGFHNVIFKPLTLEKLNSFLI